MITNILSHSSLSDLASVIGRKLKFTTGYDLFPSTMSDVVVIVCDQKELVISGEVGPVEFEGELDELSHLVVNEMLANEVDEIISENSRSFFFKEQRITDVLLLREQIAAFHQGEKTWDYCSDTGVTLCMESGFIKVQRISHFDEILGIEFSQQRPSSRLRSTPQIYKNDLFNQYVIESSELSVAGMLREAKVDCSPDPAG